jgi:hypothetical protein
MKTMTRTARSWYSTAAAGLRVDQAQMLDSRARSISDQHGAPRVGGNHVLEALLETGLYQRVWPDPNA